MQENQSTLFVSEIFNDEDSTRRFQVRITSAMILAMVQQMVDTYGIQWFWVDNKQNDWVFNISSKEHHGAVDNLHALLAAINLPTHEVVKPPESILLDKVEEIKKRYRSPIGMQAMEMALLDLVGWPGGCLMFHLDQPDGGNAETHGFQLADTPGFRKEITAKLVNMKQLLVAQKEF